MAQCNPWFSYPDTEATAMMGCQAGFGYAMKIVVALLMLATIVYLIRYYTRRENP